MKLVSIFEHIPILKQLPNFSLCRVFGTYPGFETITCIHINVILMYLRNYETKQNKNVFFFHNLKIIKA